MSSLHSEQNFWSHSRHDTTAGLSSQFSHCSASAAAVAAGTVRFVGVRDRALAGVSGPPLRSPEPSKSVMLRWCPPPPPGVMSRALLGALLVQPGLRTAVRPRTEPSVSVRVWPAPVGFCGAPRAAGAELRGTSSSPLEEPMEESEDSLGVRASSEVRLCRRSFSGLWMSASHLAQNFWEHSPHCTEASTSSQFSHSGIADARAAAGSDTGGLWVSPNGVRQGAQGVHRAPRRRTINKSQSNTQECRCESARLWATHAEARRKQAKPRCGRPGGPSETNPGVDRNGRPGPVIEPAHIYSLRAARRCGGNGGRARRPAFSASARGLGGSAHSHRTRCRDH
jgi:hypothetical protein